MQTVCVTTLAETLRRSAYGPTCQTVHEAVDDLMDALRPTAGMTDEEAARSVALDLAMVWFDQVEPLAEEVGVTPHSLAAKVGAYVFWLRGPRSR